MTQKVCTKCKFPKDLECFDLHSKGKQGRHPRCKSCRSEYESDRYKNLPEHRKGRWTKWNQNAESKRFRVHKLPEAEFLAKVAEQEGKCAICKRYFGIKLCIDHDHETGENRGLLCFGCNAAIGMLQESIEVLQAAIEYVRKYAEA